jgi:hypothetical protein
MKKFLTRKRAIALGLVASLAVAAAAFAYWTGSGSGTGSASTAATGGDLAVSSATLSPATGLVPGGSTTATGTITNGNTYSARLIAVTPTLATTPASGLTCAAAGNFTANAITLKDSSNAVVTLPHTMAVNEVLSYANVVDFNDLTSNQDGCKNATVTETITANPAS